MSQAAEGSAGSKVRTRLAHKTDLVMSLVNLVSLASSGVILYTGPL